MRRLVAGSVAAIMLTLGVPVIGTANGTAANVLGQVVDAGGRGASGKAVELVQNGAVILSTTSGADGRFLFNSIAPGNYVVRAMIGGQPAGLQVSLKAGESMPVTVVLPSMVAAQAQAQFASLLANLSTTVAGTTMATVVTELATAAQADADEGEIEEALESQATLTVLINAMNNAATGGGLSVTQLTAVATALSQVLVSVPENAPTTLVQDVQSFIQTVNTINVISGSGAPPIVVTVPRGPIVSSGSATL